MVSALEANVFTKPLKDLANPDYSLNSSGVRLTALIYLRSAINRMTEHQQQTPFFHTSFGHTSFALINCLTALKVKFLYFHRATYEPMCPDNHSPLQNHL